MLHVISVAQAEALARDIAAPVLRTETLPLAALSGRVTAAAVCGADAVPAFRRSTMDGYAVTARDVFGAGEAGPVYLQIAGEAFMGKETLVSLQGGDCVKIPTGGMLPAGADAVVPVEYTEEDGFGTCLVYRAVSPKENVTQPGDDVKPGECIFSAGTRLTPAHVGVLAAAGITRLNVRAKPRVGVLSTGNELVPADAALPLGKVRDVNAHLLSALCSFYGCEARSYGIVPDNEAALRSALARAAAENDLVLLSGGSSAGEQDLTAKTVAALGTVLAHGVAMKPGKPTVIGKIGVTPVFGLPGHPAACYFVCETLVRNTVEILAGAPLPQRKTTARLGENISSNHGREEFICVTLAGETAVPVYGKSGVVSQLSRADGYIVIPRNTEGLPAGSPVEVILF